LYEEFELLFTYTNYRNNGKTAKNEAASPPLACAGKMHRAGERFFGF
jgi:hypothetical protein